MMLKWMVTAIKYLKKKLEPLENVPSRLIKLGEMLRFLLNAFISSHRKIFLNFMCMNE